MWKVHLSVEHGGFAGGGLKLLMVGWKIKVCELDFKMFKVRFLLFLKLSG